MSVISFISPERQQAALDFIKWFAQEDVQAKWAELGGYTCNSEVLESDAFLNANPYNPAFAETMTFVKDFFNIPTLRPVVGDLPARAGQVHRRGHGHGPGDDGQHRGRVRQDPEGNRVHHAVAYASDNPGWSEIR